jgi:hypothetical protein
MEILTFYRKSIGPDCEGRDYETGLKVIDQKQNKSFAGLRENQHNFSAVCLNAHFIPLPLFKREVILLENVAMFLLATKLIMFDKKSII